METLKRLPFKARKAVFEKLEKIIDISALSKEEREMYDESIKVYRDTLATMAYAEEKGMADGLAKGIEVGREEERLSNACKMKAKGMDASIISDITGLTIEEIDKL